MVVGLLMGRKNSQGFPGKNLYPVAGKPMMMYPLLAALGAKLVDEVYVTTDDERIMSLASKQGAKIIHRPKELCTSNALGEAVYEHGYHWIKEHVEKPVDIIVLLMCNAATITSDLIDQGIKTLKTNPSIDSAVSVSVYNMWSPIRARRVNGKGLLDPFIPFEKYGNIKISCDRDSQGDVYFADMGVSIVRARCIENMKEGVLPQRWMGKKIFPLKQWGGFDVDYEWQIPALEYWVKKNFKENKAQLAKRKAAATKKK